MALSKDEQRTLDEIERALLDDDPTFESTVDFDHLRRRRSVGGGLAFLLGLTVLVAGEIASQEQLAVGVVGAVVGFVSMVAAVGWILHRQHHI